MSLSFPPLYLFSMDWTTLSGNPRWEHGSGPRACGKSQVEMKRSFPRFLTQKALPTGKPTTGSRLHMEWDNKDNQAYVSILLQVNLSVAVLAASSATANTAWIALRAAFGQTGPLANFTEFKSMISQKISTANPTLDIMVMNENF